MFLFLSLQTVPANKISLVTCRGCWVTTSLFEDGIYPSNPWQTVPQDYQVSVEEIFKLLSKE